MASRLGRKTAGQMVAARADRLSAELLTVEEGAFKGIADAFAVRGRQAAKYVADRVAAGRTPRQIASEAVAVRTLTDAAASAVADTEAVIERLGVAAARLAADAIVDELTYCERTLAARYGGLADDVADNLAGVVPTAAEPMVAAYHDTAGSVPGRIVSDFRVQCAKAADGDELALRLFSPDPVGLRGFGGRGVWWRATTSLEASARAVSIETANLIRGAGMRTFNTVGEVRGA